MTKKNTEISCIGISYIQPILDLYSKVSSIKFSGDSIIRVSSNENGYSASIVTLVAFCIESLLNNLKYHNNATDRKVLIFFQREYSEYGDLVEKLNELITLRNIIAHNHIWKIKYDLNKNNEEVNISKELEDGYGDTNYRQIIDLENRVTKKLRLRIIPTRIGLNEAKESLFILAEFSDFLDAIKRPYISNHTFSFSDDFIKFADIVKKIKS